MTVHRSARTHGPLTRQPVSVRVRASVWTAGFGWARTAARNRWRSSAVRYFRPCWSTSSPGCPRLTER